MLDKSAIDPFTNTLLDGEARNELRRRDDPSFKSFFWVGKYIDCGSLQSLVEETNGSIDIECDPDSGLKSGLSGFSNFAALLSSWLEGSHVASSLITVAVMALVTCLESFDGPTKASRGSSPLASFVDPSSLNSLMSAFWARGGNSVRHNSSK